ncbi:MAG: YceI family protein, partial [Rhodothermales bacterium]
MRTSLVILILALVGLAFAGSDVVSFKPDKNHSRIGFKVRHLGIANVRGSFGEYDATVRFDPAVIDRTGIVSA